MSRTLYGLLSASAARTPHATAVEDPVRDCHLSYSDLEHAAGKLSDALQGAGVTAGDRVGIYAPKSTSSVAAIFATLKLGAAYVPVDYTAPPERNAYIFNDCSVRAVVVQRSLSEALVAALDNPGTQVHETGLDEDRANLGVDVVIVSTSLESDSAIDDLAYILYTSGSTGKPKGVMHTNSSALGFVDWCSEAFAPTGSDKFSAHASFHFDLSILDLYVPIKHGAAIVLIGEDVGKQPAVLAPLIAETGITMWYSTPSILRLLVETGKLAEHDYSKLRIVNFAGEVFPIKHLRAVKEIWRHPRYFNLYGPTETNVCTAFEIPAEIEVDQTSPFPIGYACSGDETMVVDHDDAPVPDGSPGELLVSGDSVMQGYWNLPDRNDAAFYLKDGKRWYRTGDVVIDADNGCYEFVGRRDRMVKRRGYRIELGEIESALYRHSDISEAAVVATPDETNGVKITAFVSTKNGERIGLIAMKRYCSQNLPLYMIPDRFNYPEALPKTSTDKVDYQKLATEAQ